MPNSDAAHHIVRERLAMGDDARYHVAGTDAVANGQTKPLLADGCVTYRSRMGVEEIADGETDENGAHRSQSPAGVQNLASRWVTD